MITKSEIKQAVLQNFGCDADDWLEAARKGAAGFEGARLALREAVKNIQQIAEVVDKDIENGEIAKLDGPLMIAAYAKKQVTRAVDSLALAGKNYSNRQIASQGEIAAYERVLKYLNDKRQVEIDRLKALEAALASGELVLEEDGSVSQSEDSGGNSRPPGVRPTMGVAAERRAEGLATKVKLDDETSPSESAEPKLPLAPPEPVTDAPQPVASKAVKKKVVKRGGRQKGSKNKPKTGHLRNASNT